jgi:nuclear transport factor 2 (NTF2) superfamily protein
LVVVPHVSVEYFRRRPLKIPSSAFAFGGYAIALMARYDGQDDDCNRISGNSNRERWHFTISFLLRTHQIAING